MFRRPRQGSRVGQHKRETEQYIQQGRRRNLEGPGRRERNGTSRKSGGDDDSARIASQPAGQSAGQPPPEPKTRGLFFFLLFSYLRTYTFSTIHLSSFCFILERKRKKTNSARSLVLGYGKRIRSLETGGFWISYLRRDISESWRSPLSIIDVPDCS